MDIDRMKKQAHKNLKFSKEKLQVLYLEEEQTHGPVYSVGSLAQKQLYREGLEVPDGYQPEHEPTTCSCGTEG